MSLELRPVTLDDTAAVAGMTFPAYRHLLALQPTPRHPEQGDTVVVRPVGIAAWDGDRPVGLALGELPTVSGGVPELLSLFVPAADRRRGIATGLVGALETLVAREGFSAIQAVYTTGKPEIEAVERLFQRRGWQPPVARTVTVRFSPQQALATNWFGRLRFPNADYQVISWTEVTAEEREALRREQETEHWIPDGLEPWRHDRSGFDEVSSVGLRKDGRLAGWVINHRVSADTVRFTCSWMRDDMRGLARILPLYTESLRRLMASGTCAWCMFITPVGYTGMVEFVKRRCAKWGSFFGETKGTYKAGLQAPPADAPWPIRLEV
jgi:GNAT superfamily N-acetyltransferase